MDNRKRMGKNKDEVIFVGLSEPNWCCRMEKSDFESPARKIKKQPSVHRRN